MATLYITEFTMAMSTIGTTKAPILPQPPNFEQTVTISATAAQSGAFDEDTNCIRVIADAACSILIGANPVATAANMRLAANVPEYFGVPNSFKLSVITNS
jgi:hypothetical protein